MAPEARQSGGPDGQPRFPAGFGFFFAARSGR